MAKRILISKGTARRRTSAASHAVLSSSADDAPAVTADEMSRTRAADRKYHELLNSIYDAVLFTDLDGRILEVNSRAERMFVMNADDMHDCDIADLIVDAGDDFMDYLNEHCDATAFNLFEAQCVRASESVFASEIVVTRLAGRESQFRVFFIRDVSRREHLETELVEANEALIEAEKTQSRLDTLTTLYHELNNPLQIISCLAELDANPAYKEQVDRIMDVLDQMGSREHLATVVDGQGVARFSVDGKKPKLKGLDKKRILVVDDEELLRDFFMRALSAGFPKLTIDTVGSGREAVARFKEHLHTLMIVDLSMENMRGDEAYREIEAFCHDEDIPVPPTIFCTGYDVKPIDDIVGDGSYHCYLKKPLGMNKLLETVGERLKVKPAVAFGTSAKKT